VSDDYAAFDGRFPLKPFFAAEDFDGCQFGSDYHGKTYADRANAKRDAEIERLRAELEELQNHIGEHGCDVANLKSDNARLREALHGVIREADRETAAFIKARAALEGK
jgi:predicted  nucleic acid-binding Zn-ribbon protein